MDKKSAKALRLSLEWGLSLACLVALIQGGASLSRGSILGLGTIGSTAACVAAREHGWFRSPYWLGLPLRTLLVCVLLCIPFVGVAFVSWPKVGSSLHTESYLEFARTAFVTTSSERPFVENEPVIVQMTIRNATPIGVAREVAFSGGTAFVNPGQGLGSREEDTLNSSVVVGFLRFRLSGLSRLEREEVYFYFFGAVKWKDDTGVWESQTCSHLLVRRSDLKNRVAIWRECQSGARHNFIRHPFSVAQD